MDRFSSQGPHDAFAGRRLAIGACVLDLARGELFTATGERATLRPKVLELLCVLGARAGEVVGKDELILRVWPDVVVTEDSLTQAVAEIRRCVGDLRREWLRTVPRRGYTLVKAAAPSMGPVPHRLPARDAPLLGRADDLKTLGALLQPGALVTVLGAGGIGKTRLALELAHRVSETPGGAAWWADLAPASDDAQVLPMVAAALGVTASGPGARAQLIDALGARHGLLVLDNCEHRVGAVADLVQALRDAAPGMSWLATSQTPLQLHSEQSFRLGTLEVPDAGAGLDSARQCGAIALLEQRARAGDLHFALDCATLPPAIEICRRLDGLALAIEMAAARLPALGVGGVHAMLGARLDRLSSERRDVPLRQRSLLAALDWSCSLLSDAQRQALQALACFAGRFDADAACEVIGTEDALEVLCALVDKSLVSVESTEPRRYRLLVSMRLFARDRLDQSDHFNAVLARHHRTMARVARQFDKDCAQGRDDALLWRYLPQLSDLEQAFDHACQSQDAAAAAMLLDALRTLDAMRGVHIAMEYRLRAIQALLPSASASARARICLVIASCGWIKLPGLPAASAAAQAVQDLRAHASARWPLQRALLLLAIEQARGGDTLQAVAALDEAINLARPDDPLERRAIVLASAGYVAYFVGDNLTALARMERACELAQLAGASSTLDYAMSNLSGLALLTGDIALARHHAARAVERARGRHTPVFLAAGLTESIEAELAAGDIAAALQMLVEAVERAKASGTLKKFSGTYAKLAMGIGEVETACRLLGWTMEHDPVEPNAEGRAHDEERRALALEAKARLGEAAVQRLLAQGACMPLTELAALAATLGGTSGAA
ncbi:MAG: winged helix-turn-helix domain-containing protein [Vitreoscilla sp.]|nr:winged helix-turn-helix domain-containing protein [Vitreoscilla sp.]MBP6674884.1 winged helix-turn-helix domain-containing protein [Vitreoscilla sp.]